MEPIASSHRSLFEAAKIGDIDSLRNALKKGANPNYTARHEEGQPSSLHESVKIHNVECTKLLLESGANIDSALLTNCNTPLIDAAAIGADDICRLLIQEKDRRSNAGEEDVDDLAPSKGYVCQSNSYGNTPLHAGVRSGSVDTVRLLMDYGADLDASNHVGSTLLHLCAYFCKNTETSDGEGSSSANDRRASRLSAVEPHVQMVAMAVASGKIGDIDCTDVNGMTALHVAAERGCIPLVKLLVDSGSCLSLKTAIDSKGRGGRNAVECAIFGGMKETRKLLEQLHDMKQSDESIIVTNKMAKDLEGGYSMSNPVVGSGGAAVRRRSYAERTESETSSISVG